MEAWRFGFDPSLPPAFKFDPTDADLVAFYLLPRALNLPSPHAHAIVDADPASCPPWELLRRHGHAGAEHAFFFGPPREVSKSGVVARISRAVPAGEDGVPGKWRGQKGQDERLTLFSPGSEGEMEIVVTYRKYNLTYYNDLGENGKEKISASGWVMQEYQIVDPPLQPGVVLARVKIAERATKQHRNKRKAADAAAAEIMSSSSVPYQETQPGVPSSSNCYDYHNAFNSEAAGTSSSTKVVVVPGSDNDDVSGEPVVNFNYTDLLHSGQGMDCYSNYFSDNMNDYLFSQDAGAGTATMEATRSTDGGFPIESIQLT